jgi:hypothetical protein
MYASSCLADDGAMTKREIHQRVARMIAHLDRLLMERQLSEPAYDDALKELAEWEEAAMFKLMAKPSQDA